MIGLVVGLITLVAVVAAGLLFGLGIGDEKSPAKSSQAPANAAAGQAGNAARHLASVPALRYNGSFSSSGSTVQAQFSVTKAGSASGTVTVAGERVDLVSVDGSNFIKAGENFWRSHGGVTANPEDYAGKWSRAPSSALDLNIKELLGPAALVKRLQAAASEPAGGTENINGTQATKVSTDQGDIYVSSAEPFKVLRLQSTGADAHRFDVTEVSSGDVNTLFTEVRGKVAQLAGALDPGVRLVPVGGLKFTGCGPSSCTMKYSVTAPSAGGGTPIRAMMRATIRAAGRDLGTCADARGVGSGGRLDLGCTVTSSAWKSWAKKASTTPGSHRYEGEAHVVAEVISATEVRAMLAKIDQERQGG